MTMKTRCSDFEDRLGDLLEEALPHEDTAVVREHMTECPRCRQLMEVARGRMDLLPAGSGQELAREILRKTIGSACARVREQICDYVDGRLSREDSNILAIHIENCEVCRELTETLQRLTKALPHMADLDPGAAFTRRVLAVTCRREQSNFGRGDLLAGWWNAVVRRPRFAWEAAYVGTLILALVIGNPVLMTMAASSPLETVRGKTHQVWNAATEELTGLRAAASSGAAETAGRLSQEVAGNRYQTRESAVRLWQKWQGSAADTASLSLARVRGWGVRLLQTLESSWKSLAFDRTFS